MVLLKNKLKEWSLKLIICIVNYLTSNTSLYISYSSRFNENHSYILVLFCSKQKRSDVKSSNLKRLNLKCSNA